MSENAVPVKRPRCSCGGFLIVEFSEDNHRRKIDNLISSVYPNGYLKQTKDQNYVHDDTKIQMVAYLNSIGFKRNADEIEICCFNCSKRWL
jgi:hypothetical protein